MLIIFNKVKIRKNWNSMYADYLHALLSPCFIFCVLYCLRALFFCAVLSPCALLWVCALLLCDVRPLAPVRLYTRLWFFSALASVFVCICSCALIGYPHMPLYAKIWWVFRLYCPRMINLSSVILHHAILLKFYCFWVSEIFTVSAFLLHFFTFTFCFSFFVIFFYSWWVWKVLYYM